MPHKRAKRSVREKARAERKLDLPPSESTFKSDDIPKSMARVLNAEAVQSTWREKKRSIEGEGDRDRGRERERKKRKTDGAVSKAEIKIKPGESMRHFKQRVEDDMRPLIRSAMKNTTSLSKQKQKESQKDAEQLANDRCRHKGVPDQDNLDSDSENTDSRRRKDKRKDRSPSPDFVRVSSSAPKRLNDIVQAPPELKVAPRLSRLTERSRNKKNQSGRDVDEEDADNGVISMQQKRMMELEREKAINRYRALKEAKLKEQQKAIETLT